MSGTAGPLLALDRILELEPGRRGVAVSHVSSTMDVFSTHFPRFPVLPGVLILDAIGRLSARVLEAEGASGWRLAAAEQVRFRHYVRPGDQLELTATVVEVGAGAAQLTAEARVDGKLVATVRRIGMQGPAG